MVQRWKTAGLTLAATICLAGGALAQGFGFGPPMGGGGMLLRMPTVQTELKLTDAQKTKVDETMARLRDQRRGAFQDLRGQGPEAFQKKMAEWQASEDKQVAAILDADQQKRYHQLQLQRQGVAAIADKAVADTLKLSEEQRGKVQAVLTEQRQAMRSLFGGPRGPDGPGGPPPGAGPDGGTGGPGGRGGFDPEAMRSRMEAQRKQMEEKIMALLTDEQKKQWKEMLGAPFTFPAFGPGGPGGRGGPGGPGGPPPAGGSLGA